MNAKWIRRLKRVTPEEEKILAGTDAVQRELYTDQAQFIIEHEKLLSEGRLITARKHTRFISFPPHAHNYVEFFFTVSGSVTHIIEDREITVHTGELLFMNQHIRHSTKACGENDLAVNLIIMPEFFEQARQMVGADNILADFMVSTLQEDDSTAQYLYFPVADDLCIQNLMENIVYSIVYRKPNMERILQTTMGLMFLHLLNTAERGQIMPGHETVNMLSLAVRQYVRDEYRTGSLQDLARRIGYSQSALSRKIKKYTGFNFKELQAKERMQRVMELLYSTEEPIRDIALEVGYENHSFFYKRFQQEFDMTPKEAREKLRRKRK